MTSSNAGDILRAPESPELHTGALIGSYNKDRKSVRLSHGSNYHNAFARPSTPQQAHSALLDGFEGFRIISNTPSSGRLSVLSFKSPQLSHLNRPEQLPNASFELPPDAKRNLTQGQYWKSDDPLRPISVHSDDQTAPTFESTIFGRYAPNSAHRKMQLFMWLHSACFPSDPSQNFLFTTSGEALMCFHNQVRESAVIRNLRESAYEKLVLKGPIVLSLSPDGKDILENGGLTGFKKIPLKTIVAEAISLAFSMRAGQELIDANHRVGILMAVAYLLGHGLFPSRAIKPAAFVFELYTLIHQEKICMRTADYSLQHGSEWNAPFFAAYQFVRKNVRFFPVDEAMTAAYMKEFAHIVKAELPVSLAALHFQFKAAKGNNNWSKISSAEKVAGQKLGLTFKDEKAPDFLASRKTPEDITRKISDKLNHRVYQRQPHTWADSPLGHHGAPI